LLLVTSEHHVLLKTHQNILILKTNKTN